MTRIASYLRNPMTKQYIKFLIKADSVNESVLPRNQAPTLSIQESPAAALNLSSGNAGSCCKGWYPCFCFVVILFYESAESVPTSLGPETWGREIGSLYRDSWLPVCQICIPAGIFAIYMTDGNRILPWSFLISFSIHLYCISPPFLQPPLKILF